MIRTFDRHLGGALVLALASGCSGRDCGAPRLSVDASPSQGSSEAATRDAISDVDGSANDCAGASVRVRAELEVTGTVEPTGFGPDRIDDYNPIVSLRVSREPAKPDGQYMVVSAGYEGKGYARGYTRGVTLSSEGFEVGQLVTGRNDIVENADGGGSLIVRSGHGLLSVAPDGRLSDRGRTVGWAQTIRFGAPPADGGAPLASTSGNLPHDTGRVEEFIGISSDGGVLFGDRFRTLFALTDIDPLDACRAETRTGEAWFECKHGDHPSARVKAEGDALVVTIMASGSPRTLERLPLPEGACVSFGASYRQFAPVDERYPPGRGAPSKRRFGPFEGIASDHSMAPSIPSSTRCLDAGPGPQVDVHLVVPRHASPDGASIFIPALGIRKSLGIGHTNVALECEARAYPRSSIAVVRCYEHENETSQRSIFAEQNTLLMDRGSIRRPDAGGVPLPCNATVRYVIRYE